MSLKRTFKRLLGRDRLKKIHDTQERLEATNFTVVQRLDEIRGELNRLKQTVNMLSVAQKAKVRKARVLILVHNPGAWESLDDVYALLKQEDEIDLLVASINRRFTGSPIYRDEEVTDQFLTELGIPHVRFNNENANKDVSLIRAWSPDLIFRQSQWDADIPYAFSTANLGFTKLALVPYEIMNFLDGVSPNVLSSDYHRSCTMVFCANDHAYRAHEEAMGGYNSSLYVTGHPKVNKLRHSAPHWPIIENGEKRRFRVLWSAHHSIHVGWNNFGVFLSIYQGMLEWARSAPDIDFVLSLHPALTMSLEGTLDEKESQLVATFFEEWDSLENTAIFKDGAYGPLFASSDLLLVDGISWLLEYQTFYEKPIVFLEREDHLPFTEAGEIVERGLYKASDLEQAKGLILKLKLGEMADTLVEQRRLNYEALLQNDRAAHSIVEVIKSHLL